MEWDHTSYNFNSNGELLTNTFRARRIDEDNADGSMAGRDETSGRYTARPSGEDHERRDTETEDEEQMTRQQQPMFNMTETEENRGRDTDGARQTQRQFETPGQPRNQNLLSPVGENSEKTVKIEREKKAERRQPMSPAAQKEAEEIQRKLQELQDEMDRIQDDVKARKLFDEDEDEMSGEDEETDEDEDEQKEGSSGSDDDKQKKEKRRGAKDKRQDFTDVMGMFGEEDGSEYLNDIQRLHAAVVVDELQHGLSRTLGSKASIGSLTSLVKTMKERRKPEIDVLKAKLRIRGHRLFDAMKKFMVMLVVEESLSLTLASMLMTVLMYEEKADRCSNAIVDIARQMCMANDTSEWQEQLEDCREGKLQTEKLARGLGSSEKKMGYRMLDPSSRRITSGKKQAKKEAIRQLGQSWSTMVTCCGLYLSYVVKLEDTWEALVEAWRIMSPGHYLCQRTTENVATLMGRHREAIRELKNELNRIEESEHEPKEKEYVRNLLLAPLAPVKARITELMLERRLDKEKMTEKKATEMIVEAEYDLEKYTNYDFEKGGGKQQQQQQQPHQPTQRRIDGRYAAGQECKFGVACNDPKCRGIMTHKDKDGGMQKVCRFGHGCRDKEKGCKDWHPRWQKGETNSTSTPKGKGGGKGGNRQVKTDLEKAKMAYSREKKVSVRTVEDSKVSSELAKWLQKYEETQKKLQMHNMGQKGGRAYLDGNNELMEIPAPNVFNIESQDLQWELFEPKEGQRRPNSFNMEVRGCTEEKAKRVDGEALLKLTKQRLRAMEDRRVDDRIAKEITRIMMEEAGEKSAEQVSSMKNFMYTAYELSWGDQPKTEEVVMHDEEQYSYDLDGKYTAHKPSWTDRPEIEKAIVQEEPQQMQVPAGYVQGMDEESTGDDEEVDSEEGDEEISIMIVGSYGEDGEHQDDGRCERGMDRSGDYRCECKWEVTSTVIVQGVDGLRAVEGTEKICFGCAEERCGCKSCELRADEEEYEEDDEATRPRFGTYSLRSENEMVDMASRNETAASPTVMRIQREVAETEITGRRTEAGVNFEELGRGGPGRRSNR